MRGSSNQAQTSNLLFMPQVTYLSRLYHTDLNTVGDSVQSFPEAAIGDILCSSLIHKCCHSNIAGKHVGPALPTLGTSMLTVPSYILLCVRKSVLQGDSLHDFSWHQSEALFLKADFQGFLKMGATFFSYVRNLSWFPWVFITVECGHAWTL